MRQIKFRTWDKQNQEFSEWTNRDPFFSTSHGKIFFWERTRNEDGSYGGDVVLEDTGDRFVLQQFTGLTDSEGKEIYEGDIVNFQPWEAPNKAVQSYLCSSPKKIIYGLEGNGDYNTCGWVATSLRPADLESGYQLCCMDGGNIKVVGNIFENPELTK